jgi:diguanylate cyclase (GGDEF)-like protein
MRQQPIDFRELLERVLPLEQLPAVDRFHVQRALRDGVTREVESAALMAMERLEDRGALRRISSSVSDRGQILSYQPRDSSEVITLELPGPVERDGVLVYPRASLPTRAPADLRQVRRLLRLEDIGILSDPRSSQALKAIHDHLGLAGLELLGTDEVKLFPLPESAAAGLSGPLDPLLAAEAIAQPGQLFYCPDVTRSLRLRPQAAPGGTRALALAGVTSSDGATLGLLEVRTREPLPFQAEDLARVGLLADFCGAVLERAARLEKLVFVDASTGVYNRSYFELQAANEMARAQRDNESMALCIADIDDFKSFNTAFGYEAGNAVLTQVAQALKRGVRPFDTVARWGGEEFAVLLTAPVEAHDVLSISERLRATVERMRPAIEGLDRRLHEVSVTVSIGVAMFPEHGDSPPEMWRAANRALLLAKRPPKNKVVLFRA